MSIHDTELEVEIFVLLRVLDTAVGRIESAPLRHDMSERIGATRMLLMNFNEADYELSQCDPRYV